MSIEALNRLILSSGCFSGASIDGWTVDAAVLGPLLLGLLLYGTGVIRLWRAAGVGHGATPIRAACFGAGWLCMAIALVSPLHEMSRSLFTAHMTEHELVTVAAAPLLVLSEPLGVLLWAFPKSWRRGVARGIQTIAYLLGWDILTLPLVATLVHAVAIWAWHIPPAFDAALGSEILHWLQHLSFLVTALFFWWAMLGRRQPRGTAIGLLFLTGLHTAFLGVVLSLARAPLYPAQVRLSEAYGADPLADQQLAGLIMWVPGGIAYLIAGLVLAGLWIAHSSERSRAAQG